MLEVAEVGPTRDDFGDRKVDSGHRQIHPTQPRIPITSSILLCYWGSGVGRLGYGISATWSLHHHNIDIFALPRFQEDFWAHNQLEPRHWAPNRMAVAQQSP
jgi:hypothetical protein